MPPRKADAPPKENKKRHLSELLRNLAPEAAGELRKADKLRKTEYRTMFNLEKRVATAVKDVEKKTNEIKLAEEQLDKCRKALVAPTNDLATKRANLTSSRERLNAAEESFHGMCSTLNAQLDAVGAIAQQVPPGGQGPVQALPE